MTDSFTWGKQITPQERDAKKFTPPDAITMDHSPVPVHTLPQPDSVTDGTESTSTS
jgi:hypothetical protein